MDPFSTSMIMGGKVFVLVYLWACTPSYTQIIFICHHFVGSGTTLRSLGVTDFWLWIPGCWCRIHLVFGLSFRFEAFYVQLFWGLIQVRDSSQVIPIISDSTMKGHKRNIMFSQSKNSSLVSKSTKAFGI